MRFYEFNDSKGFAKEEIKERLRTSSKNPEVASDYILNRRKAPITSIQDSFACEWSLSLVYIYNNKNGGDCMNQRRNSPIYKHHPNINLDYFKVIDSKDKAYWLGWLFAEGWMSKQKGGIRFGVEISIKEEILIDRFVNAIGFNPKYKKIRVNNTKVGIRMLNSQFTNNLMNHGFIVGREKSKNIQLPYLNNRELYLAFLLGYYDCDGKVRT